MSYFIKYVEKDSKHPAATYILYQYGDDNWKVFADADSQNPDYQQYLEWLAEGNEPEEWTDGN